MTTTTDSEQPKETPTEKPAFDPLIFVVGSTTSYLVQHIERRWCRSDQALRFTPAGMARVGQIFGFITGLYSAGEAFVDLARRLAVDICKQFDYLACYGGRLDMPNLHEVHWPPRYIVELGDDGGFNSFSVVWLVLLLPERDSEIADQTQFMPNYDENADRPCYRYAFSRKHGSFNGGLIYSGPVSGQTFTVSLANKGFWSVHT